MSGVDLQVVVMALLPKDGTPMTQEAIWQATGAQPRDVVLTLQALMDLGRVYAVSIDSYAAIKQGDTL